MESVTSNESGKRKTKLGPFFYKSDKTRRNQDSA